MGLHVAPPCVTKPAAMPNIVDRQVGGWMDGWIQQHGPPSRFAQRKLPAKLFESPDLEALQPIEVAQQWLGEGGSKMDSQLAKVFF